MEQNRVVSDLTRLLPKAAVADRRETPSYGYRAVHVIPRIKGKLIEIQVRTLLQHLWGDFSEKLSDRFDPSIKYGGGDSDIRLTLHNTTRAVAAHEGLEERHARLAAKFELIKRARTTKTETLFDRAIREVRIRFIRLGWTSTDPILDLEGELEQATLEIARQRGKMANVMEESITRVERFDKKA
ncbi:MAG: hypothetical protein HYT87_07095 [Nitrospirae bacterium]|nr:hypothetical protein [Nitrospirota bacterium]